MDALNVYNDRVTDLRALQDEDPINVLRSSYLPLALLREGLRWGRYLPGSRDH